MQTKKETYKLPGIRSIRAVDCRKLASVPEFASEAECAVPVLAQLTDMHIIPGEPECTVERETADGGASETCRLTFRSPVRLQRLNGAGFVVETVAGDLYLIGSLRHPWPSVKRTGSAGIPSGDPAGYAYEAEYKALCSLRKCGI